MSRTSNHLFSAVMTLLALAASLPESVIAFVPAKYKPYAVAIPVVAMWLKGHLNLEAEPPAK